MEDQETPYYRENEKMTKSFKEHGYSSLSFKEYIVLQREKKKRVQKMIVTFLIIFGILFFPLVYIIAIIALDKSPTEQSVINTIK